jgi:hypothetical protein
MNLFKEGFQYIVGKPESFDPLLLLLSAANKSSPLFAAIGINV